MCGSVLPLVSGVIHDSRRPVRASASSTGWWFAWSLSPKRPKLPGVKTGTWARLVVASFGAAALIAAAQLGVGQALSIIDVGNGVAPGDDAGRDRLLPWLVFVFGAAILGGVAIGRRVVRRRLAIEANRPTPPPPPGRVRQAVRAARRPMLLAFSRVSAAVAAAIGSALAFPLIWVPARSILDSHGLMTIGIGAGAGVAVGLVLAIASLVAMPIGAALVATVGWVWMIALASVVLTLASGRDASSPRLGTLDVPWLIQPTEWWFGPYLMVGLSAAIAVAVAGVARWVGASRLGITLCGFAGPALVASAYLVTGPGLDTSDSGQIQPFLASIVAATAGLLVSAAIGAGAHQPVRTAPLARPVQVATPATTTYAVLTATPTMSNAPLAISAGPSQYATDYAPADFAYATTTSARARASSGGSSRGSSSGGSSSGGSSRGGSSDGSLSGARSSGASSSGASSAAAKAPVTVEGRVLRADPPRRIEAGTFIDVDASDSHARADARLRAEEREQKAQMAAERKARTQAEAAARKEEQRRRAEEKARLETEQRARNAEAKRLADEAKRAEAARVEAARVEAARVAAAAEAKRQADVAEARRQAEDLRRETERVQAERAARAEAAKAEAARAEAAKAEAARAEAARVEAAKAEAARAEATKAEAARAAAAKAEAAKVETARAAAAKAEAARLAKEKAPPKVSKRAAARAEKERLEAKAKADAAAKAEAERVAKEAERARVEAERKRVEAEAKAKVEAAARAKAEAAAARGRGKVPAQSERNAKPGKDKPLRKGEAEHIDWVTNLVNLPHDPELKTRRR